MIYIPGNVPSSKNSKIKTSRGVFNSKTVSKYLQKVGVADYSVTKKTYKNYKTRINLYELNKNTFIEMCKSKEYPLAVGFHFVRDSKRQADYHNLVQIVADLMVSHGWIKDDSMNYFKPVFLGYSIDKVEAGVIISVI